MKQLLLGVILGGLLAFGYYKSIASKNETTITGSQLIELQLKNVSKLVVTEGYFSDVITYQDAKKHLDLFTSEKKAVVLVNAKASIAYNLKEIDFSINEKDQIIRIVKLPEPEIQFYPKLKYYDLQEDFLNPFKAEDYNKIADVVDRRLLKQIENSNFKTNAQNRLVTELYYLFNKGSERSWSVEYDDISDSFFELKN